MLFCTVNEIENDSDRDFIRRLYEDFKYLMLSTAKKYASCPEDREDIVQESILRLIKKVDTLRVMERRVLAAYVVYTVSNVAKNHLRHASVEKNHFAEAAGEPEAGLPALDELMALRERAVHLEALLERLSPDERTLLIGKYVLGCSDEELGAQLGCKPASVRMKLTRARRRALAMTVKDEVLKHDDL